MADADRELNAHQIGKKLETVKNQIPPKQTTKPATPAQGARPLGRRNDAKSPSALTPFVGVVLVVLAIGGVVAYFVDPAQAKTLWLVIGPILSTAVVEFIRGLRPGTRRRRKRPSP